MTHSRMKWLICLVLALMLLVLLTGCSTQDLRPVDPQPQQPATPPQQVVKEDVVVTYNYGETGPVQLSNPNPVLKVGQRLILQPAPGFSGNTRFVSSGENFFGDIMEQQENAGNSRLVFVAKRPGKGRLQIIPNTDQTDRATDLWVTVEQ